MEAGYVAMRLIFTYKTHALPSRESFQEVVTEARLNVLALEYGYRYRLDIEAKNGQRRTEFVRTLREARFVGRPIRRSGGSVRFFEIDDDGNLTRRQW
jgi:hypothetical protein